MSSRGVLLFANNNSGEFDYLKFAYLNSLMIRENLGIPNITLVTDKDSLEIKRSSFSKADIENTFDRIILTDKKSFDEGNIRTFRNTNYDNKQLPFYNKSRWQAYWLSPYDETLLLDADYLIMSKVLNNIWESENEIMMNKSFNNLMSDHTDHTLKMVSDFTIPLYWATAVYFRKSPTVEIFFNIVKHVSDNYRYYRYLYGIESNLYRNDFAFSIAAHMIAGFTSNDSYVSGLSELPIGGLYKIFDSSDIHKVNGKNDITFYLEKQNDLSNYILVRAKEIDVHVMNKWALQRHSDELIELYK